MRCNLITSVYNTYISVYVYVCTYYKYIRTTFHSDFLIVTAISLDGEVLAARPGVIVGETQLAAISRPLMIFNDSTMCILYIHIYICDIYI